MKDVLNIYQKLTQARKVLHEKKIKKTSYNTYSDFMYYNLDDILPTITEINHNLGICTIFTYVPTENIYKMTLINTENLEDCITFTMPNAIYGIQKIEPTHVQNIGAINTYIRRYLYLIAYDITEPETIDVSNNADKKNIKNPYICNSCNKSIQKVTLSTGKQLTASQVFSLYNGDCYNCAYKKHIKQKGE